MLGAAMGCFNKLTFLPSITIRADTCTHSIRALNCDDAGQGETNGDYQIKFLADQFVKAPFWYAQKMLAASHQPNVCGGYHLSFSAHLFVDWMAAVSDDGKTLVIRVENPTQETVPINAALEGGAGWNKNVPVVTLAGSSLSETNDFETPDAVIPVNSSLTLAGTNGDMLSASLVPFSFTIFTLTQ